MRHSGELCSVEGCNRFASKKTLCSMHATRLYRKGHTDRDIAERYKGRPRTRAGYVLITVNGKRKYEHIHLAEKALGKKLPAKAVVHHVNNKPYDNFTLFNLVICPDQAYHLLLHRRTGQVYLEQLLGRD